MALNKEIAGVISEARSVEAVLYAGGRYEHGGAIGCRAGLLFNPAELYGSATAKLCGASDPDTDNVTREDIAQGIRMTAAKIRAGDRTYIFESMLGQAIWLQALALQLSDYTATSSHMPAKVALGSLLLKMQAVAGKMLASLAGLSCLEDRQPKG